MREATPRCAIPHQLKALDDMAQGGGPTALVVHGVRLAPGGHNPDQGAGAEDDERAQNLHQDDEVPGDSFDEAGGNDEGEQHPDAVDQTLDSGGSEAEREAQIAPVSQQVAADQFAGAREALHWRKPDMNGLHGAPETQPDHGGEQGVPSPGVRDVNSEVGQDGDAHPPPIERANGLHEFVDAIAVRPTAPMETP